MCVCACLALCTHACTTALALLRGLAPGFASQRQLERDLREMGAGVERGSVCDHACVLEAVLINLLIITCFLDCSCLKKGEGMDGAVHLSEQKNKQ